MALNGNTKWVIGIIAAFVIPATGAIAGFAVGNYRIGQTEIRANEDRTDLHRVGLKPLIIRGNVLQREGEDGKR
jgi:hypothetical protein